MHERPDIEPRVFLFGTCYVDSEPRADLTRKWAATMLELNSDCDIWLIDSQSPFRPPLDERIMIFNFPDNVGHLSRPKVTMGKDGWGRAFCRGLQKAIDGLYDYAVHIEADSLFRLRVMPICRQMKRENIKVASIPVNSANKELPDWIETGLIFFDVKYLKETSFIKKYDWPNRRRLPTPEIVIRKMLGNDVKLMPWKGIRQDKYPQINHSNIDQGNYDWITHFHNDGPAYDRFLETIDRSSA